MKVLLSAYSCSPGSGSEPGVGWNWAINLAKLGHQVWVATRENNKINIEKEIKNNRQLPLVNFIYFDLPPIVLQFKNTMGVHAYYELWQYNLYKIIKIKHKELNFELIHHITFGVLRQPSYLYKLNIPLVFGPIGGAEYTPDFLKKNLPFDAKIWDFIREKSNNILLKRRAVKACLNKADLILSKTEETANFLKVHGFKSYLQPEIGIDKLIDVDKNTIVNPCFSILYIGRLLHWKGIHLALKAFKIFAAKYPDTSFTIIGIGPFEKFLKNLAVELEISDKVIFKGWVNHQDVDVYYKASRVFLFPSLHDSSGNVVLEAMKYHLPVVALALGGPNILLGKDCPTLVAVLEKEEDKVIKNLAATLSRLYTDENFYRNAKNWTATKIVAYHWVDVVRNAYKQVDKFIYNPNTK